MNCRVCQSASLNSYAKAMLLGRSVEYYECASCKYLQTEEPTWLADAYASPINSSDTGIMARNLSNVGLVLGTLISMGTRNGLVVDYAGGHGILVRLLRDIGIDAYWKDPYCDNLVAKGFEYSRKNEASLVTAFEAFEHFIDPMEAMREMTAISPNILFTTTLAPRPTPQPTEWWYYGLNHGQHIGFYRLSTLTRLAQEFNLSLISNGTTTHLFTARKYSRIAWRVICRLCQASPRLASFGLQSKTLPDHRVILTLPQ